MRFHPLLLALLPGLALANPRPLPFTYQYETLSQGSVELEQFVDVNPVLAENGDDPPAWTATYGLTTEVEYGITDRLELGLYFVAKTEPGAPGLVYDGIKQRLRYRLMDEGDWPVDVSVYGEVAEMHDELALELKLNLQRRVGPLRIIVNLSGEREFDYHGGGEWKVNPSGGLSVELRPWVSVGAEYWLRWEIGEDARHFAGPVVMVQWKRLWFTVGAYARLDSVGKAPRVNDPYGRVWVRSVLGLNL